MRNGFVAATGTGIVLLAAAAALAFARPVALPEARAQTVATGAGETGPVMMGIGGAQQNQNDLCWILFRDKGRDRQNQTYDRYALCLYRAVNNGHAFDLVDVRELSYDFKISQLNIPGHSPALAPKAMKRAYEEALRKEEEERKEEANRNRKP